MNGLFCVAVHALIYLDKRGEQLSSEELAANICTNPARVRKVMAKLKRRAWWPPGPAAWGATTP